VKLKWRGKAKFVERSSSKEKETYLCWRSSRIIRFDQIWGFSGESPRVGLMGRKKFSMGEKGLEKKKRIAGVQR